jgi:hypothetical protein
MATSSPDVQNALASIQPGSPAKKRNKIVIPPLQPMVANPFRRVRLGAVTHRGTAS